MRYYREWLVGVLWIAVIILLYNIWPNLKQPEQIDYKETQVAKHETLKLINTTTLKLMQAWDNISGELVLPEFDSQKRKPASITPSAIIRKPRSTDYKSHGGWCTNYVWSKNEVFRDEISGNANQWEESASRSDRLIILDNPEPGAAVEVSSPYWAGHIVHVDETYADGTIKISEQNYKCFGCVSTRVGTPEELGVSSGYIKDKESLDKAGVEY